MYWTLLGISLGVLHSGLSVFERFLAGKKDSRYATILGHLHLFNKSCQARKAFIIQNSELKTLRSYLQGQDKTCCPTPVSVQTSLENA